MPLIVAIVIDVIIFLELLLEFIIPILFPEFLPWHHQPAAAATTGASQNYVHRDEEQAEHASEIELTTTFEDNGRQETEPTSSDVRAASTSDERPASASNERHASASETTGNHPDEGSSPSKAEEGA